MEHIKINQIETILKKHGMDINFIIFDFLKKFKVKDICKGSKFNKADGYAIIEILMVVLTIPLVLLKSVNAVYKSEFNWLMNVGRNAVYRFMNCSKYNWRKLIYKIAIKFVRAFESESSVSAFIIDDTTLFKEGYKCERVTRVYDHTEEKYGYGFKQVTLAYCDGKSIIPIDSSLHGEQELAENKTVKQFEKVRETNSNGAKRMKEFLIDKLSSAMGMIYRAIIMGFRAKYVIFDCWYSSNDFIEYIVESGMVAVCAIKMNRKCVYNGRKTNISDLLSLLKNMRKPKKCAKKEMKYYDSIIEIPGIGEVKICLCRRKGHKEWKAIICTDPNMTAEALMKTYALRWSIEVFFKEAKGMLRLGKCQSIDFDAQISNMSISMLLYIIITYYRRINDFETTGELFEASRQDIFRKTLAEMLWDFFTELLDYIIKELYSEGKTMVKRIKNTIAFKNMAEILSRKNFRPGIEALV